MKQMDNYNNNFDIITKTMMPYLNEHQLELFSIKFIMTEQQPILQILIEDQSQVLDLDHVVKHSEALNNLIDEIDSLPWEDYALEISTPGAERPLRNIDEFKKALAKYIYLEFNTPVNELRTITGTLTTYNEQTNEFQLEYFIKGRKKMLISTYDNVLLARLAVKF